MLINRPFLRSAWSFLRLIIEQFFEKKCQKSAASLTYVTLFAIVPLMTVTYSMFSIIPAFQGVGEQLQGLIFEHLLPTTGQELVGYLQDFSNQARKLTVVGVIFLVVSAYFMLANIEENFNAIWGVPEGRKGIANFLLYWAILSLGPLLLGAGLAMSTYLLSLQFFNEVHASVGILQPLFRITPLVLSIAAFTLLFATVPNCKVPLTHALIGGVVTALVFEVLKMIFSLVVSNSSYTLIYGTFAMVPLFLLWINLIWMTILAGAVLVRTISTYQITLRDKAYPDLLAALLILWKFHQASIQGSSLDDRQLINGGMSNTQWQRLNAALLKHHVITATSQGDYVLSQDLHYLTLARLREILKLPRQLPESNKELRDLPWYPELEYRLGALEEFVDERFDISIAALFGETLDDQPVKTLSDPS
ncbi:YihY family inner membrane protein [Cellvibrio polysaccharolyticus]|nr:YihY family inner membrane protein [Cellvibrio polysaccharolyticus]